MKKIIFLLLTTILILSTVTLASNKIEGLENYKVMKEPKNPLLEKVEIIHYKKGFGKEYAIKFAGALKPSNCYKLMGVKWNTFPVNYVINPTNNFNLDQNFIGNAVFTGAEEWDKYTSKELFNNNYVFDNNAKYGVLNNKNEISFGNYPQAGVIAVTTVWYNRYTRQIVEFDMMLDNDWNWGDATANSNLMDVQNIATHELGHGVGLDDLYNKCTEETMYGYSNYGETSKRTLNTGDITGIQRIYGI